MKAFEDAFNLLCGNKIGGGSSRDVFTCRLRDDLVVKVEHEHSDWRSFANVHEMRFWSHHEDYAKVADWLAPCEYLSPDGRILLQRRAQIATMSQWLPKTLPTFLTDLKVQNFGWIDDKFVCVDYAITNMDPPLRRCKAKWWDADA